MRFLLVFLPLVLSACGGAASSDQQPAAPVARDDGKPSEITLRSRPYSNPKDDFNVTFSRMIDPETGCEYFFARNVGGYAYFSPRMGEDGRAICHQEDKLVQNPAPTPTPTPTPAALNPS